MTAAGSTTEVRKILTSDDRNGIRRTKPLTNSLATTKPAVRTQLTPQDARGIHPKQPSKHDQLVKQTQVWVAQTFFGAMLKQMRESPFKSDLFNGGRGGEAFSALYDQNLSERMARGAGSKLVNSIVHRIEARAAQVKQQVETQRTEN